MGKTSVRPHVCEARPNLKWVVSYRGADGKRKRSYFETREAAEAGARLKKTKVQKLGWRASQLDDKTLMELLDVRERLKESSM